MPDQIQSAPGYTAMQVPAMPLDEMLRIVGHGVQLVAPEIGASMTLMPRGGHRVAIVTLAGQVQIEAEYMGRPLVAQGHTTLASLWTTEQLARLYVDIERVFTHPDLSDRDRDAWTRHITHARGEARPVLPLTAEFTSGEVPADAQAGQYL